MEYQELKYLRDEINQRVIFFDDCANKTINMVLLIWGGVLVFFGKDGIKITEIGLENVSTYLTVMTVFFISNLVLYYTARKHYEIADGTYKLIAYLAIFYEKRPHGPGEDSSGAVKAGENTSTTFTVGEDFCWELATFEIAADNNNPMYKKDNTKRSFVYFALTLFSILFMLLLSLVLFFNIPKEPWNHVVKIILPLICTIYLGFSAYWLYKICQYKSLKNDCGIKARHMNNFIQYALYTEYDTEESLNNRLGHVWNLVKNKIAEMEKAEKNNWWDNFWRKIGQP